MLIVYCLLHRKLHDIETRVLPCLPSTKMATETVKRSIKLTIKTSKLAEIASKNIIYISSCINQILTKRARLASPHFPTDWNRHSIETYFFE